jgi:DNA-binding transcriptional ArsR family regulator
VTESERKMAAKVLRAMGHPVRLGVLECLRDGPKTIGGLFRELGCSQSMMSQQIQNLEYHGLVASRREGAHKYCSLSNRDVLAMLDCLRRHLYNYLSGTVIGPAAHAPGKKEQEE